MIKKKYKVTSIKKELTHEWFMYKHYAKRIPPITYAFGLFNKKELIGVCTYGSPISKELCTNACGKEYKSHVIELNRLVVNENLEKNSLSFFLGKTFNLLPKPKIIVSYADTQKNHHGYIYQATNWIYTGLTTKNFDWKLVGTKKHTRTLGGQYSTDYMIKHPDKFVKVERSQKHRYFMILGNKKIKQKLKKKLSYNVLPYPKGENKKYDASYKTLKQTELF